jgi:hypothetical protein
MSEAGRLAGIFWEPKPVFQSLVARPRFWAPLILLSLLSVLYMVAFSRVVGWESMMRRQLESNPRIEQLTPQQKDQALQQAVKFGVPMGYAGAVLGSIVMSLVIAAVMLGCFNLLGGGGLKYRQAFSITIYSLLPSALATILAMVVMFLKDPADFDLQSPLPLNLGAFLNPQTTAKWLHALATSFDLFGFWVMLLMALGFSVAVKRMTYGKALMLVLLPWALMVLLRCGWVAALG